MPLQAADDLRSERDLRQQVQYLLALAHELLNELNIHLCFSTGGDTVQQAYLFFRQGSLSTSSSASLLCRRKGKINIDIPGQVHQPVYMPFFQEKDLFINQPLQLSIGSIAFFE